MVKLLKLKPHTNILLLLFLLYKCMVRVASSANPRLLVALCKTGGEECMKLVCPGLYLSWISLTGNSSRNSISSRLSMLSTSFLVIVLSRTTLTLHDLTDFYIKSVPAHCITINYNSCFHTRWLNKKTRLKWKHLWEQGCFRGVMQLAYSAYRENRLW